MRSGRFTPDLRRRLERLDYFELERVDNWIHRRSHELVEPPPPSKGAEVVEEKISGAACFRLELVRCGKPRCACMRGKHRHGPYWYAYRWSGGRTQKKYVGKELS